MSLHPDEISIIWSVDDVLEVRPDLNRDQAIDVLYRCKSKHDASIGINWDVLAITAEYMFPELNEPDDGQPSWEQEWSDFGETYDDEPSRM